jgi:hypothetical protein
MIESMARRRRQPPLRHWHPISRRRSSTARKLWTLHGDFRYFLGSSLDRPAPPGRPAPSRTGCTVQGRPLDLGRGQVDVLHARLTGRALSTSRSEQYPSSTSSWPMEDLVRAALLDRQGLVHLLARHLAHFGERPAELPSLEFRDIHHDAPRSSRPTARPRYVRRSGSTVRQPGPRLETKKRYDKSRIDQIQAFGAAARRIGKRGSDQPRSLEASGSSSSDAR